MTPNLVTAIDILTSDGQHNDRLAAAPAGVVAAAGDLAVRLTRLFSTDGCPPRPAINSGYRTPAANAACGGAPHSSHLEGKAVDFSDPSGVLSGWCYANTGELTNQGLWMEARQYSPSWVHLQSRPVGAMNGPRIFNP